MSVVTVTPEGEANIRRVLAALRKQTIQDALELVVVVPSRERLTLDEAHVSGFLGVRIVESGPIRSSGAAIAQGVRAARAPIVAYAEEHSYPNARWAQALVEEHDGSCAAVGAALENENPDSLMSWADLFANFGPWVAPASAGARERLPSHHTSYKTAVLLEYGDRLEEMLECEGILHEDLRRRGHELRFRPEASCRHLNVSRPVSFFRAAFRGGRIYGAARARDGRWSSTRRILFAAASPIVPLLLARRRARLVREKGRQKMLLRLLPLLLAHGVAQAAGEVAGTLLGAGDAPLRRAAIELERYRHVRPADRPAPIPGG